MESLVRNIDQLSPAEEHAVEALVGHRIDKRGQVLLLILDDPTPEQRSRWDALMANVSQFHRNVAATGASQADLDHEIDQTIEEVRSGRP
jgi:hypothetical protein